MEKEQVTVENETVTDENDAAPRRVEAETASAGGGIGESGELVLMLRTLAHQSRRKLGSAGTNPRRNGQPAQTPGA